MNEIVDVRNVGNLCRLCLSAREPKSSVFTDQANSTITLAEKIQTHLSIEILNGDKLSTVICFECTRRVNKWHSYKEFCMRSQKKLKQCLGERNDGIGNIKIEPSDFNESPASPNETVPLSDSSSSSSHEILETMETQDDVSIQEIVRPSSNDETTSVPKQPAPPSLPPTAAIKREMIENEDNHALITISTALPKSPDITELLLNPMAVTGQNDNERLMEADSTQKTINTLPQANRRGIKKKVRRGPQTHYRGLRRYKQRCAHCQIYLHSKYSYSKHMERFHSGKIVTRKPRDVKPLIGENLKIIVRNVDEDDDEDYEDEEEIEKQQKDDKETSMIDIEMIEDVEDELVSLEKDSPLTPVQQNIISQLKTFSCYTCRLSFNDRRSTLNHIRQHMPDLRPYTCIACLTEFADRSIYKLHCGASFQCAMKIALVVPKHGMEKYFTCNMCLRSLNNRKELLCHLSRHSDKQYEQLLNTAETFVSPPRLKPNTNFASSSSTSYEVKKMEKKITQTTRKKPSITNVNTKIPAPYKNGDPRHNHNCIYCGMIYRYKQNMHKHVILCKKLPSSNRICYRCIQCGITFLAFNKFYNHVSTIHKKRELTCHRCNDKFQSSDFIEHYRQHYDDNNDDDENFEITSPRSMDFKKSDKIEISNGKPGKIMESLKLRCTLCPNSKLTYPTKTYLSEHRKLHHSKLSTHRCDICHANFDKSSILESHMIDHEMGILTTDGKVANATLRDYENYDDNADEQGTSTRMNKSRISIKSDPGLSNTECQTCGKVFANYPNLRRHIRTVHDTIGRYSCFTCAKTFVREEQWRQHVDLEHRRESERVETCPQCPAIFESQQELLLHRRNTHGLNDEEHLACYICGKSFANETSLKIHRGHHFRVNSRLNVGNNRENDELRVNLEIMDNRERKPVVTQQRDIQKSPRARKSFPNSSPVRKKNSLQCQVCPDRFNDVTELRKHLWDVHCARNKPEKPFTMERYQCELCTNVLPDEESLSSHVKWHENNPILSNGKNNDIEKIEIPAQCDLCGKFYSSVGNLRKHKKRHKMGTLVVNKLQNSVTERKKTGSLGFTCNVCDKVFAMRTTMIKHKIVAHPTIKQQEQEQQASSSYVTSKIIVKPEIIKPVRPKLDFDTLTSRQVPSNNEQDTKKSLICSLCRKIVPDIRALYKHRQFVHKITNDTFGNNTNYYEANDLPRVACTICTKLFSNVANMRQHFTKVHAGRNTPHYRCGIDGCTLTFKTIVAKTKHEKTHGNVMYTCALCSRHMLSPSAMAEHMLNAHKTNHPMGHEKMLICKKVDLDNYIVKGANGRQCPVCKITYPNNKALKVHYLKVHEGAA